MSQVLVITVIQEAMIKQIKLSLMMLYFLARVVGLSAQTNPAGLVTFVSSDKVYVRFETTESISIGDTLALVVNDEKVFALIVLNKSSSSTINQVLGGLTVAVGTPVLASINSKVAADEINDTINSVQNRPSKMAWHGSVSAATYLSGESFRNMYRAAIRATPIADSKLSFDTYIALRQAGEPEASDASIKSVHYLNVYKASIAYDVASSTSISLGRMISSKFVSLGPIDGIQIEQKIHPLFFVGAIAGFKPSIETQTLDFNRPEYGAFVGSASKSSNFIGTTTLGLLDQRFRGVRDRNYAYFQHNSTLFGRVTLFSSLELDLYNKLDTAKVSGEKRLTSFYISSSYRPIRNFNFSLSYDTRKRIIYYETYRAQLDQLLADDQDRQGIRIRGTYNLNQLILIGISYNKRYQSNFQNASDNYQFHTSVSPIPGIGGKASISLNRNESAYLRSRIVSVRYGRSLIPGKLQADVYARQVNYSYTERPLVSNQEYIGIDFNYRFVKKLSVSGLGELAIAQEELTYRLNLRVIKRF